MRSAHPHAAGYDAKQRVRLRLERWHRAARSYCVGMGESLMKNYFLVLPYRGR